MSAPAPFVRHRLATLLVCLLAAAGPVLAGATAAYADHGDGGGGGEGGGGEGGGGGGSSGGGSGGGGASGGGEHEGGGRGGEGEGGRGGGDRGGEDRGGNQGPGRSDDADRAREAVAQGWALSLQDVLPTLKHEASGEIVDVNLKRRANGSWLYDFVVLSTDGRYLRVSIDAKRNRVIDVRRR